MDITDDSPAAVGADSVSSETGAGQATEASAGRAGFGAADASDLDADPGHAFDQTNGVVDGLEGDDDGTVDDTSEGGLLLDPTLSEDETRQRPDEDGRP